MTEHPQIATVSRMPPEAVYLAAAILTGAVLLTVTPPMQVPDEGAHFERAWQISEGTVIPTKRPGGTGGMLPVSINEMCRWFEQFNHDPGAKIPHLLERYRELSRQPVRPDERMFIAFSNTAAYPPVPYLPQAAGILVGRWCGASVLGCLFLARVFNLLGAAAVYSAAIRIAPFLKWTMVLLGLTPMSLFLMASASSDALTNAACALLIATLLRLAYAGQEEERSGPRRPGSLGLRFAHRSVAESPQRPGERPYLVPLALGLLLLAALLGVVKQGYYPLILLVLLVPWQQRRSRRWWLILSFAAILTTAAAVAGWAGVVRSTYSPMADRVDPQAQLDYILAHPLSFSQTLLTRMLAPKYLLWHAEQFLGFLGTLDTPLPGWLLVAHGAAILLVAARESPGRVLIPRLHRAWIGSIVLINLALLAITIYVTWMGVGADEIRIQGRYLIPFGLPVCAMLQGAWPTSEDSGHHWPRVMGLFFVVETAVVVSTLLARYYPL